MYIRFVVSAQDEDSGKRKGVFQAVAYLCDRGELYAHESELLLQLREWFNRHLEKPVKFSRVARAGAKHKAISWFKDSAIEHIAKMREVVAILEAHYVHVEILQTDRPGYIVYEDEFQVTAEAFRDTAA